VTTGGNVPRWLTQRKRIITMTSSTQSGDESEKTWLQKVRDRLAAKRQHRSLREEEERKEALKPPEEPESDNGS
jgi:hypothetical protein